MLITCLQTALFFFILMMNTPLVWVCKFSGLFIQCKLKGLQPPGKMETITRKIVTPEIQKESGLQGMPVYEKSVVKELCMIFLFYTKLHWTQASEKFYSSRQHHVSFTDSVENLLHSNRFYCKKSKPFSLLLCCEGFSLYANIKIYCESNVKLQWHV